MGRKRNAAPTNVIQLNFFELTDHVTLKTKPFYVEQHDDHWPPYAEIEASSIVRKQPRPLASRGDKKPEPFLSDKFPQHRWQKYCSGGHWVDRWLFAEDKSRRDGLRYYCDVCEARMKKQRYWAAKVVEQQAA